MIEPYDAPALLSILVANHDDKAVGALAALLIREGHVVHSVNHAELVTLAVERRRPDVCVLYFDLPGGSAFAVADAVRRLPPSRRPFLIGISGANSPHTQMDQVLAQATGFDQVFREGAVPADILEFIREIGTRRRAKKR